MLSLGDLILGQRGDGLSHLFEHLDARGQVTVELVEGGLFDVAGPELIGGTKELVDVDGDLVLVEPGLESGPTFGIEAIRAARNPLRIIGGGSQAIGRPGIGRNDGDGGHELAGGRTRRSAGR